MLHAFRAAGFAQNHSVVHIICVVHVNAKQEKSLSGIQSSSAHDFFCVFLMNY